MGLFDRFRRKSSQDDPTPLTSPSKRTVADLEAFLGSRDGVEGYVEPPTSTYAMTLCLVADDGETIRRAIKSTGQAKQLTREHGVPLYDARLVGYPQRMKDYQQGKRREKVRLDDLPPLVTSDEEPSTRSESDAPRRADPDPSARDDPPTDDERGD